LARGALLASESPPSSPLIGCAMAMSLVVDCVKTCFRASLYFGPRKAKGAVSAPVDTPVTRSNSGRLPDAVHPPSTPAPKAPSEPPPDRARKLTTGRLPLHANSGRLARTCAHFSLTMASALGGADRPRSGSAPGPCPPPGARPAGTPAPDCERWPPRSPRAPRPVAEPSTPAPTHSPHQRRHFQRKGLGRSARIVLRHRRLAQNCGVVRA
jgi:hypothetical protein